MPLVQCLVGPPEVSPISSALTPATWPEVLVRWIIAHLADQGVEADLHDDEEESVHFSDDAILLTEFAKRLRAGG
eukprot:9172953-Pyramimonas_sp.AAC.1